MHGTIGQGRPLTEVEGGSRRHVQHAWRAVAPMWPVLGEAVVEEMVHSENTTWVLRGMRGRFVLRRYRLSQHDAKAIAAELAFLHLANVALAIDVPVVEVASNGEEVVDGPDGWYTLCRFIDGVVATEADVRRMSRQLGVLAGDLHTAVVAAGTGRGLSAAPARWTWDSSAFQEELPRWGPWSAAVANDLRLFRPLEAASELIVARMAQASRGVDEFGLIHADLRAANLIVRNGRLAGLIDFDDCGYGWFAYDAVTTLSFFEASPYAGEQLLEWVRGYRTVRALSPHSIELLPTLVMYRRLLLLAWLESHPLAHVSGLARSPFAFDSARLATKYLRDPSDPDAFFGSRQSFG